MDLTITQRALRPVVNFLVEWFFPNGAFYGKEYFDAFKKFDGDSIGQASTLWITHTMHRMNADTLDVEIKGLKIRGEPVGDFEITARLTKPDAES